MWTKEQAAKWAKDNKGIQRDKSKQWRIDNPTKWKNQVLMYTYGISYADWLLMWENQDSKCAICGELFVSPSDAHVDHDHETGQIRGLLCKKCNLGLGWFNDNIESLEKAVKFLNKQ